MIAPGTCSAVRATHQQLLYRSNSSLELSHDPHINPSVATTPSQHQLMLKGREYGSHGSIDAIANNNGGNGSGGANESFFALLEDFRPAADQRSPGPAEYLRGRVEIAPSHDNASNSLVDERDSGMTSTSGGGSSSPKVRLKLARFWAASGKPPRPVDDSVVGSPGPASCADLDDRTRRRAFAHYDVQSVTANLGYAARLRGLLLARRRNTTTGASAASARAATPDSIPDGSGTCDEDLGDGHANDLLESCPFFRNEIGGEEERVVSLTRVQQSHSNISSSHRRPLHRPPLASGVSVLEFPFGETHWLNGTCLYQRQPRVIESIDQGALYYRKYFHNQEHQNWFGMDENLGPIALSIRREKMEKAANQSEGSPVNSSTHQYRLLIRTSELLTLRGSVLEDAIPNIKPSSSNKGMSTKEVLEYVAPEIQISCLRLGVISPQTEAQLLKLDEQGLTAHYKVGVLYCRAGQASEEDMYNNEEAGPALLEFLNCIGQRVRLKGFDKYRAGLDNKTDSTGLYSVYSQYQDCEIMFHVSTLLPFTPNNRQQLLRKRHIGNDIVTIVFQEPGAQPFTPKNIRSQFQHVFIVVKAVNPCSDNTQYRVAVSRSKEVPVFGPPIREGATFPKSKTFADFLLAKVINAENAAHRSEKFATMATRTRQEYLKDLATNYTTTTVVESGQKFSMLSFSSKKKERIRPRFLPDSSQRGAISWQVLLDDSGTSALVPCFLAISTDTLVLIEERSREIVFVTPCKAVLGWQAQSNSLRLYHHQGECITLQMRGEGDELPEVLLRLRAVTSGTDAQEMTLRRNLVGQLGFHLQPDGVVTQVEGLGQAWQAGLRQGARLVEICKIAVSTLSHDQMVDLLKTSMMVIVTVVPPLADGTPRRGCTLQNCRFTLDGCEGDYENVTSPADNKADYAVPGNHRRMYEWNFTPLWSSSSSGYGTGSSSKSFTGGGNTNTDVSRFHSNPEGTLTSSSSGHSSDDRWYELLEHTEADESPPPPPLPARLGSGGGSAFQQVKQRRSGPSVEEHVLHTKVQVTHSLPLPHASFSLPLTPPQQRDFKLSDKVPCIKNRSIDYLNVNTRSMKGPDFTNQQHGVEKSKTCSLPPDCAIRSLAHSDGHSTDTSSATSDRLFGVLSEDELSAGSSNVSPRLRRSNKHHGGTLTPSSGSSRNQSPRPGPSGEARLRPGVTPRSASNRNSASLAHSTLQEDLMRLINPDYLEVESGISGNNKEHQVNGKVHSSGSSNSSGPVSSDSSIRSRSRENLCVSGVTNLSVLPTSEPDRDQRVNNERGEVILTMARPATVISNASTASSPAPSENKHGKEESMVIFRRQSKPEPLPLPDAREMDWPSLVDTATRAMLQVRETTTVPEAARNGESLGHWVDDVAERLGLDSSHSNSGRRDAQLDSRRCLSLEDEVRHLRDDNRRLREENRRLQEESQTAAQQLRRLTEWFYQTVKRQ